MIRACPGRPSVQAGAPLALHVSGDQARFRIAIYRWGHGLMSMLLHAEYLPDGHYNRHSPRQAFAHWDAQFVRWMKRNSYATDFRTDLGIHAQPALPRDYRLLVSVGHDEHRAEDTRDAVEDFVADGGKLTLFGAKLCWWRIHLADDGTAMACHLGGKHGALDDRWSATGAGRPEDSLSGASYRHGGWRDGPRQAPGFVVQQARHWIFAGTGLAQGDELGADTWSPLPAYECDGVPVDHIGPDGLATLSAWRDEAGTPAGYQLLAACPLDRRWQELPPQGRTHHAQRPRSTMPGLIQRARISSSPGCRSHGDGL